MLPLSGGADPQPPRPRRCCSPPAMRGPGGQSVPGCSPCFPCGCWSLPPVRPRQPALPAPCALECPRVGVGGGSLTAENLLRAGQAVRCQNHRLQIMVVDSVKSVLMGGVLRFCGGCTRGSSGWVSRGDQGPRHPHRGCRLPARILNATRTKTSVEFEG